MNKERMVNEELPLKSFISKASLKKVFYNEEFSLLMSTLGDEEFRVFIKRVTSNKDEEEEGEVR